MAHVSYAEFELGAVAHTYLRDALGCDGTLGGLLAEACDLREGRVTTYLPVGTAEQERISFADGGIAHYDVTRRWVANAGVSLVKLHPDCGLVMHSNLGKPDDLCIVRESLFRLVYGAEVYYYLRSEAMNAMDISRVIDAGESPWSGFGLMVDNLGSLPTRSIVREITLDDLKFLVDRMQRFFVSAYDGEGYLIWNRR